MADVEYTTHPALDRLDREPELWYDRFVRYALMDPSSRSLLGLYNEDRKLAGKRKGTRAPPTWSEASKMWRWRERAAEYDDANRRQRIQAEEQERQKMVQRHIQLAQAAQGKVLLWLREAAHNLHEPSDVIRWMETSIKIERQARGMPAEMIDMLGMSDEQLIARYTSLFARLVDDAESQDEATVVEEREKVRVER